MPQPHHTHIALAAVITALALTASGCVQAASTPRSNTNPDTPGEYLDYARVDPDKPAPRTDPTPDRDPTRPQGNPNPNHTPRGGGTLPNQPGRTYPNQLNTFTPPPRTIDPADIPDYSWMPQDIAPDSPNINLFAGCDDLPEDVRQELDFSSIDWSNYQGDEVAWCNGSLGNSQGEHVITFGADTSPQSFLEGEGFVLGDATDSVIPGARYALSIHKGEPTACQIYVMTPRGRLFTIYTSNKPTELQTECQVSRDYLEYLVAFPQMQRIIWGDMAPR